MQRHHLSEAWYIGDTQGDLDAAHGAGIPFVYCAYGFGDAEGYEKKIGRFEELMELFGWPVKKEVPARGLFSCVQGPAFIYRISSHFFMADSITLSIS